MEFSDLIKAELARLIETAEELSAAGGPDVVSILRDGSANPLSPIEAERLLTHVVTIIAERAKARGDNSTLESLGHDAGRLIREALESRGRIRNYNGNNAAMTRQHTVHLLDDFNGVRVHPVVPPPVFHEKEVSMVAGYVKTSDIRLWEKNERLEIHVQQFRARYGRGPTAEELLHIMLGKMALDGLEESDEFEILTLARSIAANGVRKPPIIDIDGTLLDGNRRLAASYLIQSDTAEFTPEEKRRVEHTFVWQLLPGALDDDRNRIIVSLNFESDHKKDWPDYIKARKIYEEWEAMLALEPQRPGPKRQAELKKDLSKRYALGPETSVVNRYIRMVRWINEFEEHHINQRSRDKFAVKHASNRYFQYFDEMSKGEGADGGVGWTLNRDDHFKRMVFDLLFDGKFENWTWIRQLKHIPKIEEALDQLARAHSEPDLERAQDLLEGAITIAKAQSAVERALGANDRIQNFVKWVEQVPPKTLRDDVRRENLIALLRALRLVEGIVNQGLEAKNAEAAQ
jgi:hypothetical protein